MYNETDENLMDVKTSIITCENEILSGNVSFSLNTMFGKILVEVNPPELKFEFLHPTQVYEFKNAPSTKVVSINSDKIDFYIAMKISANRITDHYTIIQGLVHTILLSMGLSDNVELAIDTDLIDAATLSYSINSEDPQYTNEKLAKEVLKLNFNPLMRKSPMIVKMVNDIISARRNYAEKITRWANRYYAEEQSSEVEVKWINTFSKELYAIALYAQKEYMANAADMGCLLMSMKKFEEDAANKQNIPAYKAETTEESNNE